MEKRIVIVRDVERLSLLKKLLQENLFAKKRRSQMSEEICMMCGKKLTPPTVTIPDTEDGEKGGKVHNMCFIEALMIIKREKEAKP